MEQRQRRGRRPGGRQLEQRCRGRRGAVGHPVHEVPERGLGDDVQRTVVDQRPAVERVGAPMADEVEARRARSRRPPRAGRGPCPAAARGTTPGCRPPRSRSAGRRSVRRCRCGTSSAARGSSPPRGRPWRPGHNHRRAGPAHDEEPVEGAGERLDAVDVGGQPEGGLRLPEGEDLGRHLTTGGGPAGPQRAGHLGDDVEGEPVPRVVQRPVALGVDGPEALAEQVGRAGDVVPSRSSGRCGRDGDLPHPRSRSSVLRRRPRCGPADDLLAQVLVPRVRIQPAADVEPLQQHDAVARGRRPTDHDASPVARRVGGLEGPPAVGGERSNRLVRRRAAFRGVLLQDVAGAQRLRRRRPQEHPVAPGQALRDVGGWPSARGTSGAGVAVFEPAAEGDPVVDVPRLGSGSPAHPESRTAVATQAATPVVRRDRRVRGMSKTCRSDGPPDHPMRVTRAPQFGVPSLATSTTGPRPPPGGTARQRGAAWTQATARAPSCEGQATSPPRVRRDRRPSCACSPCSWARLPRSRSCSSCPHRRRRRRIVDRVSPSGSDNADGIKKPFKTVQKATDTAPAGAYIELKPGTYAPFTVKKQGQTIIGTNAEKVVIKGAAARRGTTS